MELESESKIKKTEYLYSCWARRNHWPNKERNIWACLTKIEKNIQ